MKPNDSAWFDTHVHLDCLGSGGHPLRAAQAAHGVGVEAFVVPGVEWQDWPRLLATVTGIPGALAAPGLHPRAAAQWGPAVRSELERLLAAGPAVAVGEIGLDGTLAVPPEVQEAAFRGQLRLAVAFARPVLIHCRRAWPRLLQILDEEGAARVGGIFHGFSGSAEMAAAGIRRGFALAFGGPVTFPEARRAPAVLRQLPAEWIVLETDAPDLAPYPFRGRTNRPAYLPLIGAAVAAIRGWDIPTTCALTTTNARRVLRLPGPTNN